MKKMNNNVLLLTIIVIFLIILYYIIHIFLDDKMLSENFEVDNNNYYGLVDCEKYPYLCTKGNKNINYSQYPYRKIKPLQNLNLISPRYKRSTPYRVDTSKPKPYIVNISKPFNNMSFDFNKMSLGFNIKPPVLGGIFKFK